MAWKKTTTDEVRKYSEKICTVLFDYVFSAFWMSSLVCKLVNHPATPWYYDTRSAVLIWHCATLPFNGIYLWRHWLWLNSIQFSIKGSSIFSGPLQKCASRFCFGWNGSDTDWDHCHTELILTACLFCSKDSSANQTQALFQNENAPCWSEKSISSELR